MILLRLLGFGFLGLTAACTTAPDGVLISLAPDIVSSLDGTLSVRATVLADRKPAAAEPIDITIDYKDRGGVAHTIAPASGETDGKGVFEVTLKGLTWDGNGTVTATGAGFEGKASFAVLDRSPPKVTITQPVASQLRRGTNVTIQVHATDEIGVSQVLFGSSDRSRDRSLVTSGATEVTLDFDFQVPDVAAGSVVTLFALAEDLSGNQGAATPIMVTVIP